MKLSDIANFFCVFVLLLTINIFGQSVNKEKIKLKVRNPDGWFNLLVPVSMNKVERHADVDGGFYFNNSLDINYSYWTYENAPNFLRDANINYLDNTSLPCSTKRQQRHIIRMRIDGQKAIIKRCVDSDDKKGSSYIYNVIFPRLKVPDGRKYRNGVFNLTVTFNDSRYLPLAQRIVRSISFKH